MSRLALFYLDHGLAAEAAGVLETSSVPLSPAMQEAQWTARLAVDRCDEVINGTDALSIQMEIIGATCLAKVGQYEKALALFDAVAAGTRALSPVVKAEMERLGQRPARMLVESLIEAGRLKEASTLLRQYVLATSVEDWQAERVALNLAMLAAQPGTTPEAIAAIMRQSTTLPTYAAARLKVRSLQLQHVRGMITGDKAREQLEPVMMDWRGGTIEREALMLSASLAAESNHMVQAFADYRRALIKFGDSDAAHEAEDSLQDLLKQVFDGDGGVSVLQATALFYENIDLLAPGAGGDAQIRAIAKRLVALDLLTEAAELLSHQTFARLRGAPRAEVATILAQIHLDNDDPQYALEVLQRSRITGLPAPLVARRRQLEATALWQTGRHDRAVARLDRENPLSSADRLLKAQILADMGDMPGAQPLLFAEAVQRLSAPALVADDEALILRTMIATVEAGKIEDQVLLVSMARARLDGRPIMGLIETLTDPARLRDFPTAYRAWLADYEQQDAGTDPGI
ncbi:MAG: hypothetical protein AAFR20_01825 [Pseudomonadota bacterium]